MSAPSALYRIKTEIDFAYGHRLLEYDGKCAHPHGHNARVEIELAGDQLDRTGMLVDFTVLKHTLRDWVDTNIDHKMILRGDDPLVPVLKQMKEPLYIIEVNPTAEALAKLIYDVAAKSGFPVSQVRFWESPTSSAEYTPHTNGL